jgi:hypothetical protein
VNLCNMRGSGELSRTGVGQASVYSVLKLRDESSAPAPARTTGSRVSREYEVFRSGIRVPRDPEVEAGAAD